MEMTHEIEKEALQEFKDKGLEIVEITPEQRQVLIDATKGLRGLYDSKYGDKAAELLEDFDKVIEGVTSN